LSSGVTIDEEQVFIVHINETFSTLAGLRDDSLGYTSTNKMDSPATVGEEVPECEQRRECHVKSEHCIPRSAPLTGAAHRLGQRRRDMNRRSGSTAAILGEGEELGEEISSRGDDFEVEVVGGGLHAGHSDRQPGFIMNNFSDISSNLYSPPQYGCNKVGGGRLSGVGVAECLDRDVIDTYSNDILAPPTIVIKDEEDSNDYNNLENTALSHQTVGRPLHST